MAENQNILYAKLQFQKPQINISCPTAGRMWLVSLCALLAILQSGFSDSFYSLILAMSAVIAAVLSEYLLIVHKGKTAVLKDGSAVATALILTLLLPNSISPVYAIMGSIFAIVVIKHCFGGLGSNWLNPAAGGWLFIRLSWPGVFNKALEGSSFSLLKETAPTQAGFLENTLLPFLDKTVFSMFKVELPVFYLDIFSSQQPGIIADRGILGLLIGTILIIAFRAGRSWISAVWLLVFVFFTRMSGANGSGLWEGDMLFSLCTGGTLAAAFILAADPATNSKSNWCILGTAALGGFLAWLFRFPGSEPYGAVYSIVVINAFLPIVRNLENHLLYRNRKII
ncbi:MAG: RnfABCDGE type electron transport complex subunit D [Treponema sp.]|jgi:Na+-translocating ferredoxin:NAD+ oxidoreductase RnfD subunit|nr:RnfABCDGE type electron transport complex subunit D [Treponema sp.]